MGLTDDIGVASCVEEPAAFCDELNDLYPSGEECLRWACDEAADRCALLGADEDGDGAPPPRCAEPGQEADCDDLDPERTPRADEVCDGVDNDCNGVVDDEAFTVVRSSLGGITGSPNVESVAFAPHNDGRTLSVGLGGFATNEPVGMVLPEGLESAGVPARIEVSRDGETREALQSGAIGAAPLGEGFVVALETASYGCRRVLLGALQVEGERLALPFDEDDDVLHFDEGLVNAEGGRCLDGEVRDLAVATVDNEVLVAYHLVEPDQPRTLCSSPEALPAPAPLLVSYGRQRTGAATGLARDEVAQALELTLSTDLAPPAVLAVGPGRWLVAVSGVDGQLEIHHIVREIVSDEAFPRLLHHQQITLASSLSEAPEGEPRLALGPSTDGEVTVGLATRRGCLGEAVTVMRWLSYGWEEAGGDAAVVVRSEQVIEASETGDQRSPSLAWWNGGGEWLVASRHQRHRILGWRLDEAGWLIGDVLPPLLEVTGGVDAPPVTEPSLTIALGAGWGVVAFIPGASESGYRSARVSCGGR